MLGQQNYQRQWVQDFDMESCIPENHLLRRIHQIVDFRFVRELSSHCYCANNGRPSIDPEVFFRMMLVAHLYQINADRKLCEEIQYNLAYRWFCRLKLSDKVPHHSTLTRIRDRLGVDIFRTFFLSIVQQCQAQGLVSGEEVMTDGTLFDANAAMKSLKRRQQPISAKPANKQQAKSSSSKKPKRFSNKTHVSQTDPEASLAFRAGKSQSLKYRGHLTIDTKQRVLLDIEITTGACVDATPFVEQLTRIKKDLDLRIESSIADRAYGAGATLQALIDQGIEPIIPLYNGRSGSIVKEQDGLSYDEIANCYYCIAGKELVPYPTEERDGRIRYHSDVKTCQRCDYKSVCQVNCVNCYGLREIRRSPHQKLFEKTLEKMETSAFRVKMVERWWKMEGVIAEMKQRHGLRRAKYRGVKKTQIQAYLCGLSFNIKRLVTIIYYSFCIFHWFFNNFCKFKKFYYKKIYYA